MNPGVISVKHKMTNHKIHIFYDGKSSNPHIYRAVFFLGGGVRLGDDLARTF